MQIIEQHPYVDQVVSTLPGESPVGEALRDDATLEFLENEVMKVGSLAHTDIDWSKVESDALSILSDRSKDLKVLGFLLISLQRGGDGERFALSLYLLHRVLEAWWEQAWPYPGESGKRARRMMFTQMLQRAGKSVDNLAFDGSVGDGREFCLELLDRLSEQAISRELPDDSLVDLKRSITKLPKVNDATAAPERPESSPASLPADPLPAGGAQDNKPAKAAASLGSLTLDPGNERATRQSLLKVADMLTETDPDQPLGYQLRRHAIWHGITAVPPTRDGQRTDLAAVSADRVADYREALEKKPDLELLQRIEQSLSVSPFWLDGHWLSARTAMALGNTACAEAIRVAVKAYLERLPQLPELTFNDGTPFLSTEAEEWLWSAPASGGTGSAANAWEQAYDKARELVAQRGLAEAMQLLEDGLQEAREPRDQFYWRLASARLLKDAGFKALAAQQIKDLQAQVNGRALEDWEPALIRQLEKLG
ncbi:type VI secretion system protein TssA [Marinobacter subterrani]|uniref:type VI secretion system protein TssA n=1 Tax=Marinobacter subterrani TaxID=1658765 RepID=UPI0023568BFB|nr:type VI secretion system protein TssA [Marinobacter subterrani]